MSQREVAADTLAAIEAHRKAFRMKYWASDYIKPDSDPEQHGVTMCMAGWVCYVLGYTLLGVSGLAINPDNSDRKWHVSQLAGEALELTFLQAWHLFYETDEEQALRILDELADGLGFPNELIKRAV
jgi:hypothetical protein